MYTAFTVVFLIVTILVSMIPSDQLDSDEQA